jgi:hypothetical protein
VHFPEKGYSDQGLRSPSEPLQRRKHNQTTSATELALEFVDAEAAVMTFPFQHTKGDETTEDMMLLGPRRAGLTAAQAELLLADPHHFLNLGAQPVQVADLYGQYRQAIRGVVLFAMSDNQYVEPPT